VPWPQQTVVSWQLSDAERRAWQEHLEETNQK
jgi:hypothetical protein